MKRIFIILWIASLCACGKFIDDFSLESSPDTEPAVDTAVYMSGLEYPDGYDWKRDTAYGEVNCTLFFMKNGERILERSVGYGFESSSDRDMHRILNGSLYEDYSCSDETLVCRNGEVLWKWNGNLMINGMAICGNDLYALTSPRRGKGYTLYKNGEVVLESKTGSPSTGLKSENGTAIFSILDDDNKWKIRRSDRKEAIDCDEWKVKQIGLMNGQVLAICETNGIVVLYENEHLTLIFPTLIFNSLDVALISGGQIILAGAVTDTSIKKKCFYIESPDGICRYDEEGVRVLSYCAEGSDIRILAYLPSRELYAILHDGDILPLPDGYVPAPGGAMNLSGGKLSVSLTKNGNAAIWKDGSITDYPFNGYIDNIYSITQ